jgi:hypothetical protein
VNLGDETQRFRRGQSIEQREIFRHDADAALDLDRVRARIEFENPDFAA